MLDEFKMKRFIQVMLSVTICSTNSGTAESIPKNALPGNSSGDKDEITLDLSYNAIACTCAQWSETRLLSGDGEKVYYYLEPANGKLINADQIFDGENLPVEVRVT